MLQAYVTKDFLDARYQELEGKIASREGLLLQVRALKYSNQSKGGTYGTK